MLLLYQMNWPTINILRKVLDWDFTISTIRVPQFIVSALIGTFLSFIRAIMVFLDNELGCSTIHRLEMPLRRHSH